MLTKLWDKLESERKLIKATKLHFLGVSLINLTICLIICYSLFNVALTLRQNTIAAYRDRFGDLNSSQPKKTFQVMNYTKDPNLEKLVPPETNAAAMAYPYGVEGPGPVLLWDIKSQSWK